MLRLLAKKKRIVNKNKLEKNNQDCKLKAKNKIKSKNKAIKVKSLNDNLCNITISTILNEIIDESVNLSNQKKALLREIKDIKKTKKQKTKYIANLWKDYTLVSLGWCCYPRMLFDKVRKLRSFSDDNPTHIFDWIGTSAWALLDLFQNDFTDFLNFDYYFKYYTEDYKNMKLNCWYGWCHKKYYLRFQHHKDLDNRDNWERFYQSFNRRIERFRELLHSDKQILFFYLEENTQERYHFLYPEIKHHYPDTPFDYHFQQHLLEAKNMLKVVNFLEDTYPQLNFKILHFSSHMKPSLPKQTHSRLLLLPTKSIKNVMWKDYHYCFMDALIKNKEIVESFINYDKN